MLKGYEKINDDSKVNNKRMEGVFLVRLSTLSSFGSFGFFGSFGSRTFPRLAAGFSVSVRRLFQLKTSFIGSLSLSFFQ